MEHAVLAFDLGTGGVKAALFTTALPCRLLGEAFVSYPTFYPGPQLYEQRPQDWWNALVQAVQQLMKQQPVQVEGISSSGHSLGLVPMDHCGRLLLEQVPIWSDSRAGAQADAFFASIPWEQWYETTGNGFKPGMYPLFKLMWYREHQPDLYRQTAAVLGTKDYVNFRLTGRMATDISYASGSGCFDCRKLSYRRDFLETAGVDETLMPQVLPSGGTVGTLTEEAAALLGLTAGIPVFAGGVDNACTAMGAGCVGGGAPFLSLGSSAQITVSGPEPTVDVHSKPFVFVHGAEGEYLNAQAICSAGTAWNWARDQLCHEGERDYESMNRIAAQSPAGANGLVFYPDLAGGLALGGEKLQGAFLGLELRHTRADLLRAVLEGVAFGMRKCVEDLRVAPDLPIRIAGGGAKNAMWMQIFADAMERTIIVEQMQQATAAYGAAAIALKAMGHWESFDPLHAAENDVIIYKPRTDMRRAWRAWEAAARAAARFGNEREEEL